MIEPRALPARFAWCFGTASAEAPATRADLESARELIEENWQVAPVVVPKLLGWAGEALGRTPVAEQLRHYEVGTRTLASVQIELSRRLTEALDRANVPYTLLKGSAARFRFYPDPLLRCGVDIDIGVPSPYLGAAREVALSLGFVEAEWLPAVGRYQRADPARRAAVERRHYELGFLVRQQTLVGLSNHIARCLRGCTRVHQLWHVTHADVLSCYVAVDIHHGLCLDIPVDPIVATSELWDTGAFAVRVPRLDWAAFHLIYKLYWEGAHQYATGLHQYVDLLQLLPQLTGDLVASLEQLLCAYRLEAAAYYVLRRVEDPLGQALSPELRELVDKWSVAPAERPQPLQVNDLGDMWPKLWGLR